MSRKAWIAVALVAVLVVVGLVLAFMNRNGSSTGDPETTAAPEVTAPPSLAPEPTEAVTAEPTEDAAPPWQVDVESELDALPRLNGGPLPLTQDPEEFAVALIYYTQSGDWSTNPSRDDMVQTLRDACIPSMPELDAIADETGVTREAMCDWGINVLVLDEAVWEGSVDLEVTSVVSSVTSEWEIRREVSALEASPEVSAALSDDLNRSHFGGSINVNYWLSQSMLDADTRERIDEPYVLELTTGIMVACPRDESGCRLVTALAGGF